MIPPIQKHELEFIDHSDGLVKFCKGDQVLLARFNETCESPDGETILEMSGERWVLCWALMPEVTP